MGKGHGKVGGQSEICQNKPMKAVKTKSQLTFRSMCDKKKEPVVRHQKWLVDDVGKGHGKVGV